MLSETRLKGPVVQSETVTAMAALPWAEVPAPLPTARLPGILGLAVLRKTGTRESQTPNCLPALVVTERLPSHTAFGGILVSLRF